MVSLRLLEQARRDRGAYLTKGKLVFVEGRLQTRRYDDREGNARKVTEVVVTQLRLLSGNGSSNGNGNSERREGAEDQSRGGNTKAQELEDPLDDSVPF